MSKEDFPSLIGRNLGNFIYNKKELLQQHSGVFDENGKTELKLHF